MPQNPPPAPPKGKTGNFSGFDNLEDPTIPQRSAAAQEAGNDEFHPLRYNTKLHLINPLQLFTDYPVSYFICELMGFAKLWWVSANLISLIHPLFGLAAGIVIAKSVKQIDNPPTDVELRKVVSSHQLAPTPKLGEVVSFSEDSPSSGGGMGSPMGTSEAATAAELEPTAKGTYNTTTVNMKMLRIGCVLFSFRNFLDSMDGVIARLQRRYIAEASGIAPTAGPQSYGFNGHSVDVFTDLLGVIMCSCGIAYFMFRRGLVLSRPFSAILSRFTRIHRTRAAIFGKVVATGGLVYMAIVGVTWEEFMLRQTNLFDVHSPTNPAIWALEQDHRVRLNQFLWSLSCGDSVFSVLITALFFNKIWEAVQTYFFVGYAWYLLVALHANYVWHWVILENPVAARIIAESTQFS